MSKITIYGSKLCPDTVEALEIFKGKNIDHVFFDITEDLSCLKAFLKYRDTSSVFENIRANGGIGIPLFVTTANGAEELVTLDIDAVIK